MTLKPHHSPSLYLSLSTAHADCKLSPSGPVSWQNTGHCKSTLQSSVNSFLQNARLFFSHRSPQKRRSQSIPFTLLHTALTHCTYTKACTNAHILVSQFSFLTSFFPLTPSCLHTHIQLTLLSEKVTLMGISSFYSKQLSTFVMKRYGDENF